MGHHLSVSLPSPSATAKYIGPLLPLSSDPVRILPGGTKEIGGAIVDPSGTLVDPSDALADLSNTLVDPSDILELLFLMPKWCQK